MPQTRTDLMTDVSHRRPSGRECSRHASRHYRLHHTQHTGEQSFENRCGACLATRKVSVWLAVRLASPHQAAAPRALHAQAHTHNRSQVAQEVEPPAHSHRTRTSDVSHVTETRDGKVKYRKVKKYHRALTVQLGVFWLI